jgi:hypothetical protein
VIGVLSLHPFKKLEVQESVARVVTLAFEVLDDCTLLHNQPRAFDHEPACFR